MTFSDGRRRWSIAGSQLRSWSGPALAPPAHALGDAAARPADRTRPNLRGPLAAAQRARGRHRHPRSRRAQPGRDVPSRRPDPRQAGVREDDTRREGAGPVAAARGQHVELRCAARPRRLGSGRRPVARDDAPAALEVPPGLAASGGQASAPRRRGAAVHRAGTGVPEPGGPGLAHGRACRPCPTRWASRSTTRSDGPGSPTHRFRRRGHRRRVGPRPRRAPARRSRPATAPAACSPARSPTAIRNAGAGACRRAPSATRCWARHPTRRPARCSPSPRQDGALAQVHVEDGVDGLAPPGTLAPLARPAAEDRSEPGRVGMVFNWVPDRFLYVTDPGNDAIAAAAILTTTSGSSSRRDATAGEPALLGAGRPRAGSARDRQPRVLEQHDGSPAARTCTSPTAARARSCACARTAGSWPSPAIALPGRGVVGAGQLNGIAVSSDAGRIWVSLSGAAPTSRAVGFGRRDPGVRRVRADAQSVRRNASSRRRCCSDCAAEALPRPLRLAAVSEDGRLERPCPAVVKKARPIGQAPKRGRAPLRAAGGVLDHAIVEGAAHVVDEQIGVERDVARARAQRRHVARGTARLPEHARPGRRGAPRRGRRQPCYERRNRRDGPSRPTSAARDFSAHAAPPGGGRARPPGRAGSSPPARCGRPLATNCSSVAVSAFQPNRPTRSRPSGPRTRFGLPLTPSPFATAPARIASSGIASIRPPPNNVGVLRTEVTFDAGRDSRPPTARDAELGNRVRVRERPAALEHRVEAGSRSAARRAARSPAHPAPSRRWWARHDSRRTPAR